MSKVCLKDVQILRVVHLDGVLSIQLGFLLNAFAQKIPLPFWTEKPHDIAGSPGAESQSLPSPNALLTIGAETSNLSLIFSVLSFLVSKMGRLVSSA